MMKECLQQSTGSCLGCPVLEIAINKARVTRNPTEQNRIAESVGKKLCPDGGDILIPNVIKGRDGRLIAR